MLFCVFCILTITSWFQVQCYVSVPSIYRKVEIALRRYSSNMDYNPVIYSLLNVLVYDKLAKAFVTNEAIEKSLEDVKKFNENDEQVLRQFIYGRKNSSKFTKPSNDLKEDIQSTLDEFFSHPRVDDYRAFNLLSDKKKFKFK